MADVYEKIRKVNNREELYNIMNTEGEEALKAIQHQLYLDENATLHDRIVSKLARCLPLHPRTQEDIDCITKICNYLNFKSYTYDHIVSCLRNYETM